MSKYDESISWLEFLNKFISKYYPIPDVLKDEVIKDLSETFKDKSSDFAILQEAVDKANKVEILENALGCPLDVVFKALKQGKIYVETTDGKVEKINKIRLNCFASDIYGFDTAYSLRTYPLYNYKKTWWLKEDRSE